MGLAFNDLTGIIRRYRVLLTYGLFHVVLCMFPFLLLGIGAEYGIAWVKPVADAILHGSMPYRDFVVEYPPMALLSFLLPGIVSLDPVGYTAAFVAEMLIFDLIVLVLLYKLSGELKVSPGRLLLFYTLGVIAVGPIIIARYDILPTMLMLLALYAMWRGRSAVAWGALALGVLAKVYPGLLVPLFALYQIKNRDFIPLRNGLIAFCVVMALFTVPWLIMDANGFMYTLTYHAERGLHSESTYGTALLLAQLGGLTSVTGELTFGSWNLKSVLADNLAHWSNYILVVLLLGSYFAFGKLLWRKSRSGQDAAGGSSFSLLVGFSTLVMVVFLVASKVFSIQYVVWLCPLAPLVAEMTKRSYFVWIFVIIGALTQFIYPYNYAAFELEVPYAIIIMVLRNVLVILLGVAIAVLFFRASPQVQVYKVLAKEEANQGGQS